MKYKKILNMYTILLGTNIFFFTKRKKVIKPLRLNKNV